MNDLFQMVLIKPPGASSFDDVQIVNFIRNLHATLEQLTDHSMDIIIRLYDCMPSNVTTLETFNDRILNLIATAPE